MEQWEASITKFDTDLKARMVIIKKHECVSWSIAVEAIIINRFLGVPEKRRYLVFDHTKQWRERNRERVNAVERIRRSRNPEKFRESSRTYAKSHIEEISLRHKKEYESRTQGRKDEINKRRREIREKKKLDKRDLT